MGWALVTICTQTWTSYAPTKIGYFSKIMHHDIEPKCPRISLRGILETFSAECNHYMDPVKMWWGGVCLSASFAPNKYNGVMNRYQVGRAQYLYHLWNWSNIELLHLAKIEVVLHNSRHHDTWLVNVCIVWENTIFESLKNSVRKVTTLSFLNVKTKILSKI